MKKAIIRGVVGLVLLWTIAIGLIWYLLSDVDPSRLNVSVGEYRTTVFETVGGFAGAASGFLIFVIIVNLVVARRKG